MSSQIDPVFEQTKTRTRIKRRNALFQSMITGRPANIGMTDEMLDDDIWKPFKSYEAGEKVMYLSDAIIDAIFWGGRMLQGQIKDSVLCLSRREHAWEGLDIPLRRGLGMQPGKKYKITVGYWPQGELRPVEGWDVVQRFMAGESDHPNPNPSDDPRWKPFDSMACCPLQVTALTSSMKATYMTKYGEGWSTGKVEQGNKDVVSFEVDLDPERFTEMGPDLLPGHLRVQTFNVTDPLHVDFVSVEEILKNGALARVFLEDFEPKFFECIKAISEGDEIHPPNSEKWRVCE